MLTQICFFTISLLLSTSISNAQTINSPTSLTECAPQVLQIEGGTPPYDIAALEGGETGGVPLSRIDREAQVGSITWIVDVPAGSNVTLAVRDSTGATGYSEPISVIPGTSTDCLNTTSSDATDSATVTDDSASPSSSASFDPQSISSLIDSLTGFTAPIPTSTTTIPSSLSFSTDEINEDSDVAASTTNALQPSHGAPRSQGASPAATPTNDQVQGATQNSEGQTTYLISSFSLTQIPLPFVSRMSTQSILFYGVFVKTAYLCFASDAFKKIKGSFLGIDLICARRRQGNLSTTEGHEGVKRVPEEVWKMIKEQIGGIAVKDGERNEVLANAADYSDDELMDDENAGKWENGMINEWQEEDFYESGGMPEMIRVRFKDIKILLEAFGLALPSDQVFSNEEVSNYDRYCLSAISLPLLSTGSTPGIQSFPSTSLEVNSDYGSVHQAVKYSKQAFKISPTADHRFKSFLSMFRLQAVSDKMETIHPHQHIKTETPVSQDPKPEIVVKKKGSEAKRKAAHKAVCCCDNPDVEPHWHMWTVLYCY
ncbi:hypothetical protein JCM5353_002108 [Sporobolomyces roseus]